MSFEWYCVHCMRAGPIFAGDSEDGPDDVNPSANCQHGDDAGCLFDLILQVKEPEGAPDEPYHRQCVCSSPTGYRIYRSAKDSKHVLDPILLLDYKIELKGKLKKQRE